ncbi:hypothetical protein OUZ56_018738 [Daphnia magna]|uniref:Uncharacterized protein n=1 Tax=Daphnia magna TaxID=35525 RepID=A0ABQ9Z9M5_9CRUS|nr:hypothetical protein OUZ56_018738 [Daphnia magna]
MTGPYNIKITNAHIILLSETFWNDNFIPKFSAYHTHYLNRQNQGGGVTILIKKNKQATPLTLYQPPEKWKPSG